MPSSLVSIGTRAFYICSNLAGEIDLSNCINLTSLGESAFNGCSNLTNIIFNSQLTEIGNSTFEYCSRLTNLTLPSSLTNIGYAAFRNCTALSSVTFENTTGWYTSFFSSGLGGQSIDVTDPNTNELI